MMCPVCGAHSCVIETRTYSGNIRRRRECAKGHRFSTIEAGINEIGRMPSIPKGSGLRAVWRLVPWRELANEVQSMKHGDAAQE